MSAAVKQPRAPRDASTIQSGKRLLDKERLCDFLSIGEASLDRLMADPDENFPPSIGILQGKRHWTLESIERYVEKKARKAQQTDRR